MTDSTHNNNSTFYRWNAATSQFDYIGEVTSGPTVVQAIGTSTTDVMSQKAVTDELYNNANKLRVQIGNNAVSTGESYFSTIAIGTSAEATKRGDVAVGDGAKVSGKNSISIGHNSECTHDNCIAIGYTAKVASSTAVNGIAIGYGANSSGENNLVVGNNAGIGGTSSGLARYSVALGAYSKPTLKGQVDISTLGSTNTYGYNDSQYRLLSGLYDPQYAHDAATKGYVDNAVSNVITSLYINYSSLYDPSEPGTTFANQQLFLDEAMTQPITCKDFRDLLEDGTLLEIRAVGYADSTVYINLPIASAYYPTDEGFYDGDTIPFITMFSSDSGMQKILLHKISAEDYNASTFSCRTIEVSTT